MTTCPRCQSSRVVLRDTQAYVSDLTPVVTMIEQYWCLDCLAQFDHQYPEQQTRKIIKLPPKR